MDPSKDRSVIIPVETSIRYLQSDGMYRREINFLHYESSVHENIFQLTSKLTEISPFGIFIEEISKDSFRR